MEIGQQIWRVNKKCELLDQMRCEWCSGGLRLSKKVDSAVVEGEKLYQKKKKVQVGGKENHTHGR